jgi:hypothetical protein
MKEKSLFAVRAVAPTDGAAVPMNPKPPVAALQLVKVVKPLDAQRFEIEIGGETGIARQAFGCLIRPVSGDRALAAQYMDEMFILNIVERLAPDQAALSLPGGGALNFEAKTIRLEARESVSVAAPAMDVRARVFTLAAESMNLLARTAIWAADALHVSARDYQTTAETHVVNAVDRVAVIQRSDALRAGTVSQSVENVHVTTAPIVVIASSEDLRLDGKRVTVG